MPPGLEGTGSRGTRQISPVFSIQIQAANSSFGGETRMECDSHADTSVVGKNCLIIHDFERPVKVSGYDPKDGTKEYRTVTGVVAYDHLQTGQTYMLVVNQAIEVPHLQNHLLCPMQCRMNGVKINELPKFLAETPDKTTHALQVVDPLSESPLYIPMSLFGITSYFPVQKPTIEEWEDKTCPQIELTAEEPCWDPGSLDLGEQEDSMMDFRGQVLIQDTSARGQMVINSVTASTNANAADITDDENLGLALEANICVLSKLCKVGVSRSRASPQTDHIALSKKWGISPAKAKRTVKRTTQRGVHTVLHPSLS